jgi:hypothetical protein
LQQLSAIAVNAGVFRGVSIYAVIAGANHPPLSPWIHAGVDFLFVAVPFLVGTLRDRRQVRVSLLSTPAPGDNGRYGNHRRRNQQRPTPTAIGDTQCQRERNHHDDERRLSLP